MPSITLVGPGAIGATLATWLAQAPRHTVSVAARTPFDRLEVTTPHGVIRAAPRILIDRAQARPSDWVMVTTKAYDSDTAGARLHDSIADEIVERTRREPRDASNSILADRRAGRPMEYDARNGVIVRLGIEHEVATPRGPDRSKSLCRGTQRPRYTCRRHPFILPKIRRAILLRSTVQGPPYVRKPSARLSLLPTGVVEPGTTRSWSAGPPWKL